MGKIFYLLLITVLFVSACDNERNATTENGGATDTLNMQDDVIRREAMVTQVQARLLESFPVQVHAVVLGDLNDGCTSISNYEEVRDLENNIIRIRLWTERPMDDLCTQALVPFEHIIPLNVRGLPAGTYEVSVNGIADSFTLAIDNEMPEL